MLLIDEELEKKVLRQVIVEVVVTGYLEEARLKMVQ